MNAPPAFRLTIGALGALSPRIAARIGWTLFWRVGAPVAVRTEDQAIHDSAVVSWLRINGKLVSVYTWGTGPAVILLVHGWRSRASRFGPLVEALAGEGRTIVSFDAPGHGDSGGTTTNVFEEAEVIRQLAERHGRFESIVGHSFGVLATFHAMRLGVTAQRLVSVAGVHSLDHLISTFARTIGLPRRAAARMRNRIERELFTLSPFTWSRVVSSLDDPSTSVPLLVVHDSTDRWVGSQQAAAIEAGHAGPTSTVLTEGLGHNRILTDPDTIKAISRFVSSEVPNALP